MCETQGGRGTLVRASCPLLSLEARLDYHRGSSVMAFSVSLRDFGFWILESSALSCLFSFVFCSNALENWFLHRPFVL